MEDLHTGWASTPSKAPTQAGMPPAPPTQSTAAKRQKFFAVVRGQVPGIYEKWGGPGGAQEQVNRYKGALYKRCGTREEAEAFMSRPVSPVHAEEPNKRAPVPANRQPVPPNKSVYVKGLPDEVQGDPLGFLQLVFEDIPGLFDQATFQRSTRSPDIIFVNFQSLDLAMRFMQEKPPRFAGSGVVANYTRVPPPRISTCLERFIHNQAAQRESGGESALPPGSGQAMDVEGSPGTYASRSDETVQPDSTSPEPPRPPAHSHPLKHPYLDQDSKQEEFVEEYQEQPPPHRPRLDPDSFPGNNNDNAGDGSSAPSV